MKKGNLMWVPFFYLDHSNYLLKYCEASSFGLVTL